MRLVFVYWPFKDQGSGLVIQGYSEAARTLGHEVAVYGNPRDWRFESIPLDYTLDLRPDDAVIFLFEWTADLYYGDQFDLTRLLGTVPRRRRVVIDGDGKYNDVLRVGDDVNNDDVEASRSWTEVCDSLSDKICQPTLHPVRPGVLPFLFYAYNPAWEVPLDSSAKDFDLLYVGNSKFRWQPMMRVLKALEPVRNRVGRVGIIGHGWDGLPPWAEEMRMEAAYFIDQAYLDKLNVEIMPAVPFDAVISTMSRSVANVVLTRPTFSRLRLVTPRIFETPAATIPLFGLDPGYVQDIYGEAALELVLPEHDPEDKLVDIISRPGHYADVVHSLRHHLAEHHSHAARLRELIAIVEA
jgi:glycosyltransferase involved in cell wall biosynthesis